MFDEGHRVDMWDELPDEDALVDYAYDRLGFYEIRKRLADCASSPLGRLRAGELAPADDPDEVRRALAETGEMRGVMARSPVPLAGIHDLRDILERAGKRGVLAPEELFAVAECIQAARKLRRFFSARDEDAPFLARHVEPLEPSVGLGQEIERCINDQAELRDRASSELSRIRKGLRSTADNLRNQLEKMAKRLSRDGYLQEPIVTQRNGRYVLPVKQEYRGRVRGIVHGQSSSGATVFVEPQVAVELNNRIQELKSEEEREVQRILAELSGRVGDMQENLEMEQDVLGHLDLIYAKANLAEKLGAVRPLVNDQQYLHLRQARHPMLGEDVVPIDVEVGRDFDTLVITGPNTGGKTVTLKTVGLMVLMCQAGLHIPCEEDSDVGMFSRVYCDIGDEQSIAQNLSTFSSHMRNVIPILLSADRHSLVLLDELGAGTDPLEGAPLAMAILEELHGSDVRTMATTHYSRLKTFAYQLDGVENASMEFDVETLSPTFNLVVGLPGRSNALEIAERLGMPNPLVERARALLTEKEGSVEELIAAMEEDRKAWSRRRHEAETEADDARLLRKRIHRREHELRKRQEELIEQTRSDARRVLREARAESRELLREIHELAAALKQVYRHVSVERRREVDEQVSEAEEQVDLSDSGEIISRAEELRSVLHSLEDRLVTHMDEVQRRHARCDSEAADEEKESERHSARQHTVRLRPGMKVKASSFSQTGELIDVDYQRDEAHVQVGVMKLKVGLDELHPADDEEEEREARPGRVRDIGRSKYESLPSEVVVRQMTAEAALEKVRKHIDDAILAGRDHVTIVHGQGEGILRDAIRRYLEDTRYVRSWQRAERSAGGDGVTIAHLR